MLLGCPVARTLAGSPRTACAVECTILFCAVLLASPAASADDDEAFRQARSNGMYLMERGSYAEAQSQFLEAAKATSRSSRAWMYKHAGDAAFLQEDYVAAREYYAIGIATRFERDLWITADNPGWARALAGEREARSARVDLPRMHGTPNEVAPEPRRKLHDYEPMPAPRSAHSKEYRAMVNRIGRRLKSSSRKGGADRPMPVDPQARGVPGSGIARVVTPGGSCPAVRSTRGSYIASASCLAAGETFPATPWTLMHESGIHQPDVCTVEDYWTQAGKNPAARAVEPREDWAVLAVKSDCHPFFIESIPFIAVNRDTPPAGTGKAATIEYSGIYRHIVPVLRFCATPLDRACTEDLGEYAAVWLQLGENTDGMRTGDWRFAGFAAPGGPIVDYSVARQLVAALEKAWELGQRRRTQAEAEERAAAR